MKLPPGIRSITIKPKYRHRGGSWGLEYPLVYGEMSALGCWAVWDRHTGVVTEVFPHVPNVHGWSTAQMDASRASQPKNYSDFSPFELDAVP